MKFLKQSQLNFRNVRDRSVAVSTDGQVIMDGVTSLLVPKGTGSDRPSSPINGMIRYNTSTGEFEGYQSGSWRSFRYKESGNIVLQNLGIGDGSTIIFGPLNPDPYTYTAQAGVTWDASQIAKNLIVIVENVYQIGTINFTVVQNPLNYDEGTYLQFSSPVPINKPVYVFHNFDR